LQRGKKRVFYGDICEERSEKGTRKLRKKKKNLVGGKEREGKMRPLCPTRRPKKKRGETREEKRKSSRWGKVTQLVGLLPTEG